jgi:hypothetical protein
MPSPHTLPDPLGLCSVVSACPHISMCYMCPQQNPPGCGCKLPVMSVQVVDALHCTNI